MEDPRPQCTALIAAGHFERGAQQAFDLIVRVKIRSRPFWLEGQQALRWNLRAWIARVIEVVDRLVLLVHFVLQLLVLSPERPAQGGPSVDLFDAK